MHSRRNANAENSRGSGCRAGSLPDANVVLVTDKSCTLWPPVPSMEYLPTLAGLLFSVFTKGSGHSVFFHSFLKFVANPQCNLQWPLVASKGKVAFRLNYRAAPGSWPAQTAAFI